MQEQPKKRVGILGGSFDPVHNGHLGLAHQVREEFRLDHVVFIPAHISPHKRDQKSAPAHHRLAMLRLAAGSSLHLQVSEIELKRKGVSFTVDTLATLMADQPQTDFFLIMGMDAFQGITTWKDAGRLLALCHVIVAARPGHALEGIESLVTGLFADLPVHYRAPCKTGRVVTFAHEEAATTLNFFDLVPMDVSSSGIRDRIRRNLEIKNMLPPEVENYIITFQLYRTSPTHIRVE